MPTKTFIFRLAAVALAVLCLSPRLRASVVRFGLGLLAPERTGESAETIQNARRPGLRGWQRRRGAATRPACFRFQELRDALGRRLFLLHRAAQEVTGVGLLAFAEYRHQFMVGLGAKTANQVAHSFEAAHAEEAVLLKGLQALQGMLESAVHVSDGPIDVGFDRHGVRRGSMGWGGGARAGALVAPKDWSV